MAESEGVSDRPAPVDRFDRLAFDLDGTLWRGATLLPYADDVVADADVLRQPAGVLDLDTGHAGAVRSHGHGRWWSFRHPGTRGWRRPPPK